MTRKFTAGIISREDVDGVKNAISTIKEKMRRLETAPYTSKENVPLASNV